MEVPSASRALPVLGSGEVLRSQALHWTRSLQRKPDLLRSFL